MKLSLSLLPLSLFVALGSRYHHCCCFEMTHS